MIRERLPDRPPANGSTAAPTWRGVRHEPCRRSRRCRATSTTAEAERGTTNFGQVPLGVVVPRSVDDVVATHPACAELGAPIVDRGGGTSLSGDTVNRAIVIGTSKYMHRIGDADDEQRTVRCQPGAVNEQVNQKTGEAGVSTSGRAQPLLGQRVESRRPCGGLRLPDES